jgi:hypothetical protein
VKCFARFNADDLASDRSEIRERADSKLKGRQMLNYESAGGIGRCREIKLQPVAREGIELGPKRFCRDARVLFRGFPSGA